MPGWESDEENCGWHRLNLKRTAAHFGRTPIPTLLQKKQAMRWMPPGPGAPALMSVLVMVLRAPIWTLRAHRLVPSLERSCTKGCGSDPDGSAVTRCGVRATPTGLLTDEWGSSPSPRSIQPNRPEFNSVVWGDRAERAGRVVSHLKAGEAGVTQNYISNSSIAR